MIVLVDRIGQRRKCSGRRGDVVVRPFPDPPAVIPPAAAGGLVVNLFPRALADVADDERPGPAARGRIERKPPRVAHSEAPDFRQRPGRAARNERIRGRHRVSHRVRIGDVHVDSQHLAEKLRRVLRARLRVVSGSAVAHPDIEVTVRTEREIAAVVIRKRLRDES